MPRDPLFEPVDINGMFYSQLRDLLARWLNPQDFSAWLNSMPADAVIGRTYDACNCPVARYLSDRSGGAQFEVYGNTVERKGAVYLGDEKKFRPSGPQPCPAWTVAFVDSLDVGIKKRSIRVAQALETLERVLEDIK